APNQPEHDGDDNDPVDQTVGRRVAQRRLVAEKQGSYILDGQADLMLHQDVVDVRQNRDSNLAIRNDQHVTVIIRDRTGMPKNWLGPDEVPEPAHRIGLIGSRSVNEGQTLAGHNRRAAVSSILKVGDEKLPHIVGAADEIADGELARVIRQIFRSRKSKPDAISGRQAVVSRLLFRRVTVTHVERKENMLL